MAVNKLKSCDNCIHKSVCVLLNAHGGLLAKFAPFWTPVTAVGPFVHPVAIAAEKLLAEFCIRYMENVGNGILAKTEN